MFNLNYTVSVQNNSNRIISSSEEKFGGIGQGNLIRIGEENILYTVINKDKFSYLKSFNVQDSKTICIEENIGINLQRGDCLKLSYKEYELMMIYDIITPGINYVVGNELTIKGGVINIDVSTGHVNPTILKVNETINNGGIGQVEIVEKGKYIQPPENPVSFISDEGTDGKLELKYKECDNRTIIERDIQDIHFKDNKTYIHLNFSLPPNLIQGKLYVEKHVLILDNVYIGNTEINVNYELFRNFTPNLRMPLMLKNSASPDVIINKALLIIDTELQKLKNKIG